MKNLLLILLVLIGFIAKAQFPSQQSPTQFSTGWFKQGWHQADSGHILSNRAPNFTPRFPGTIIMYRNPGGDTAINYWTGNRWIPISASGPISASNGLTMTSGDIKLGGTLSQFTDINNNGNSFILRGTGDNTMRTTGTNFQANVITSGVAASVTALNSANNLFAEVNAVPGSAYIVGGRNGVYYNSIHADSFSVFLTTKSNISPKRLILDTLGYVTLDAYPSLTQETDTIPYKPLGINSSGKMVPMANWPGGGGAGLTSVGISMPSAFTVTNSPLTSNGTISISGSGTTAMYIRGNGTLAVTDTSMMPAFYLKVRGLISGASPVTFNQTTGIIGINNANTSGTKGAATFNSSHFSDNGSGLISLTTPVSAGSCTGCNLSIGTDGRITAYADGAGGATNNVNIGSGFRPVNSITQEMRTYFAGFGTRIDTVANTNGITWSADTTRVTGLPTYPYVDSLFNTAGGGGATLNNIGTGYRWVATSAGNIKTHNPGYGLLDDSTTLANTITSKVDTTTIDARYPKVYNVVSRFGARPDGVEKYDGAMTNGSAVLTCASCAFTSGDVGKAIRVEGAIVGGDLLTTIIGFTNSSTVTLGANATRTVSSDTLVYGTDNTPMIQAAINTAFANGDAHVWIPGVQGGGFYVLAGPLITSFQGANPNAQLVWDVSDVAAGSFNTRKTVTIEGVNPTTFIPNLLFVDSITPKYASVLYSIIDGSGDLPSVFGTKAPTSGYGFINYNAITFKNLQILVARNKYGGGPTVGGINGLFSSTTQIDNVAVGFNGSLKAQPQPTHDVAGIVVGRKDSEIYSYVRNSSVYGFKYGFVYTEDVSVDHTVAHACIFGHTIPTSNYPVVAGLMDGHWCQNTLYIPNHNLFGLIPLSPGVSMFSIDYLTGELFDGSSMGGQPWLDYVYVISDSGSRGRGMISQYSFGQGEVGLNNSLFNKFGGDSIITRLAGSRVDNFPHSWTNHLRMNNIVELGGTQNNGEPGYLYNWSPFTDASIIRMSPLSGNASQGLYLSPVGTGSSSVSPIKSWINLFSTSFWTGVNSTNTDADFLQLAAETNQYVMRSMEIGAGTIKPINIYTGANNGQVYLASNGKVFINKTSDNSTGVLQALSTTGNLAEFESSASTNAQFTLTAVSGFNTLISFKEGVTNQWYIGNIGSTNDFAVINSDGAGNIDRIKIPQTGGIVFNASTNSYTFPATRATAGQVLTDVAGNGTLSWQTPSSGSGTVTSFTFTDGGGFDGTVTNSTTTPTLSIIPSYTGLTYSNGSALGAATVSNLLEYASGTLQFNDAYMTESPNTQIFLKSRMQRLSYDVPDANFSTLGTRQEGYFKLPVITANRTFSMFSGTAVDGVEFFIYNGNTSGSFSWSFTGVTPQKASDGTSVSSLVNGVLYHIIGMHDGTNAHWIIVNQ